MSNYATSALKLSDTYVNTLPYNLCETAAETTTKVVSAGDFALETGATVIVKFKNTNSAANPTLNVSSTGAKAIYYNGAAITASYLKANYTYTFVYNGTQWDLIGEIDTNTIYTFNGAVSTIKDDNLTASRALISNGSGKVAVSDVTSTELGYLDGVTSNIQTQLNGKAASSHTHGNIANDGTLGVSNRVVITSSDKKITTSTVTASELGYLSGVTANVQTQLNQIVQINIWGDDD